MKQYLSIIGILLGCVLSACVQSEPLSESDGRDVLTVSIGEPEVFVESRAALSADDEKKIRNVYYLIFNAMGNVEARAYIETPAQTRYQFTRIVPGSKTVVAFANLDSNEITLAKSALDAVTNLGGLNNLPINGNDSPTRTAGHFLMYGRTEYDFSADTANPLCTVPLERLDARIRFTVSGVNGVNVSLRSWVVNRLPKSYRIDGVPSTTDLTYTDEMTADDTGEFTFYMLENLTPDATATIRTYADRSVRSNGWTFDNAPATATYVELLCDVSYTRSDDTPVRGTVTYRVFLGDKSSENFKSFKVLRNHAYTYNITVSGLENIRVAVESDTPKLPGDDAVIQVGGVQLNLDAANYARMIAIDLSKINGPLSYRVKTPSTDNSINDEKWVYFQLAKCTGISGYNNTYSVYFDTTIPAYPGDDNVYADNTSMSTIFSDFSNAVNYRQPSAKMINVKQLTALLNYVRNEGLRINTPIYFIAHIRDNYYVSNDEQYWKKFVNQPDRTMSINWREKTSANSKVSYSVLTINQQSIKTLPTSYQYSTSWGSLNTNDTQRLWYFDMLNDKKDFFSTDNTGNIDNGRLNTYIMWANVRRRYQGIIFFGNYYSNWSDLVGNDYANQHVLPNCAQLNRDKDGDGRIDPYEVQWYLAASNQLVQLQRGGMLSADKDYASSTVQGLYNRDNLSSSDYQNYANANIVRGADGQVVSLKDWSINQKVNAGSQTWYFRCVRNLGMESVSVLTSPAGPR